MSKAHTARMESTEPHRSNLPPAQSVVARCVRISRTWMISTKLSNQAILLTRASFGETHRVHQRWNCKRRLSACAHAVWVPAGVQVELVTRFVVVSVRRTASNGCRKPEAFLWLTPAANAGILGVGLWVVFGGGTLWFLPVLWFAAVVSTPTPGGVQYHRRSWA